MKLAIEYPVDLSPYRNDRFRRKQSEMLGRFILILVLVPLIELVLLYQLLQRQGLAVALLLVLGTGIIGISLAKRQGFQAWNAVHVQMKSAQNPSQEIMNGVMILIAGAFLMTPGMITDAIGFLLLVPSLRLKLGTFAIRWFKSRTVQTFQAGTWTAAGQGSVFSQPGDSQPGDSHSGDSQANNAFQEGEEATVRVIDPEDRTQQKSD